MAKPYTKQAASQIDSVKRRQAHYKVRDAFTGGRDRNFMDWQTREYEKRSTDRETDREEKSMQKRTGVPYYNTRVNVERMEEIDRKATKNRLKKAFNKK